MTTVKPATAEQRAHWLIHANFKWQPYGSLFSEAVTAYEAALVALESELAALKAEYVPDQARNKGEKFMEYATRVGCPPTGLMATNEAPSGAFAAKAEATIETLTKDLMEARQEADNASARHMGTTRTLNLLRGDIATALGGVYGTPGFDCIADLTAKVTQLVTGLTAEKKRSNEMHRRAQASEGADERIARVRKGYAEELRYFIDRGHAWRATWKNRYREAAAQLVAAGVPDDWVSPCGLKGRTGILSELISRLVSQRDDACAAAQVQADEIARLKTEHAAELALSHKAQERVQSNYFLVADAIAAESVSPEQLVNIARRARTELAQVRTDLQRALEAGERMQADLKMLRAMGDARMAGFEAHGAGVSFYDNPTETSGPCGHIGDAWESGWLLAAGNKARADLAAAVKRATALESANALGSAQVTQLQEELAATTAKLGRARRLLHDAGQLAHAASMSPLADDARSHALSLARRIDAILAECES